MQPGAQHVSSPMSLPEWAELDEEVSGEWADGYLVEDEVPTIVHEEVVAWFVIEIGLWLRGRGDGIVAASGAKFAVSSRRGRMPDVSVYLPGAPKPPPRASLITVPPSIAIEVVSPRPKDAKRDRVDKLAEYAAFGVRYYWIVDPQTRVVELYELDRDGRYVRAAGAADGELAPPGCEGLVLSIDSLWARVDALEGGSDGG